MPKKKAYRPRGAVSFHDSLRGSISSCIYHKFEPDEILELVESLRNKAIRRYHPDHHLKNKRWYDWKMSRINQAYDRAKHLLRHHGAETS